MRRRRTGKRRIIRLKRGWRRVQWWNFANLNIWFERSIINRCHNKGDGKWNTRGGALYKLMKDYRDRRGDIRIWLSTRREDRFIKSKIQLPLKRRFLKAIGFRREKINYFTSSFYPYYQYISIFDNLEGHMYLVSKYYWESPLADRDLVTSDQESVLLSRIKELRFVNSYNNRPNTYSPKSYNSAWINEDYILLLKKYKLINNLDPNARIPCYLLYQNHIKRNVDMNHDYICTDKKKIADKIVKVGYMRVFD